MCAHLCVYISLCVYIPIHYMLNSRPLLSGLCMHSHVYFYVICIYTRKQLNSRPLLSGLCVHTRVYFCVCMYIHVYTRLHSCVPVCVPVCVCVHTLHTNSSILDPC